MKKRVLGLLLLFSLGIIFPKCVSADEVVAEDVKYYKTVYKNNLFGTYSINGENDVENIEITKEEYDSFNPATTAQPASSSTIETTYKRMITSINKVNGEYVYKNNLSWKNFPATRSYDVIAIVHPTTVTIATALQFTTEYCTATGTCYSNRSHNPIFSNGGVATIFPLPTGSLSRLNHTMSFTAKKNTTNIISVQYIQGDYAHATSNVNITDAFNIYASYGSGIAIPYDMLDKYDTFNVTNVSYTENW